ncbi:MAG: DegV family protein [Clostridiales bacterium]|jgi:DegV family protein with EDD domain|nr:DegV family protein [Clostridiales bacterium]
MQARTFTLVTDSAASLPASLIKEYDIRVLPLTYIVGGKEYDGARVTENDTKTYYEMMRAKVPMSTSCTNEDDVEVVLRGILENGEDILYIGFSSALSATYTVVASVLTRLAEEYLDRQVYYTDSLCASFGEGRFVIQAAHKRAEGLDASAVYAWAEGNKQKQCHLFTVESLTYLFRGGRVGRASYLLAGALNIKPVMHVDDRGRLVAIGKALGRKASLNALATRCAATIVSPQEQVIYIAHGDCREDAEYLAERIQEKITVKGVVYAYVDLVVGVHSGPGTVALFYTGENRMVTTAGAPATVAATVAD